MNALRILLLTTCTLSLQAAPSAELQLSPQGMMPQLDIFAQMMEYAPNDIMIAAHSTYQSLVRATAQLGPNDEDMQAQLLTHARHAKKIMKAVEAVSEQEELKRYTIAVRRYEKLRTACNRTPFNKARVRHILDLLAQHRTLIRELFTILMEHTAAQITVQKSENPHALIPQFDAFVARDTDRLNTLRKKLVHLEVLLLKDERTWKEKYNTLIIGVGGGAGLLVGGVLFTKFLTWLFPSKSLESA